MNRYRSTISRVAVTAAATAALILVALTPGASAFKVVTEPGKGAAQTRNPGGVAVDFDSGRLYVADTHNHRVQVFDATGNFVKAFGWGVSTGAGEFEICAPPSKCREGIAGAGKGQFDRPRGIAVDQASGDVYVVDSRNLRLQKFESEGAFQLTFGGGVNQTKVGEGAPQNEQDVCPIAPGDVCGKGSEGFNEGQFTISGGLDTRIFVGVGPGGTVHVVDSYRRPDLNEFKSRLQKFEPSGALISPQCILREGATEAAEAHGLAVDHAGGDFYVSRGGAIVKYEASCLEISAIEDPFEDKKVSQSLALDDAGNLFAASGGAGAEVSIIEFDPAGTPLRRFGYGSILRTLTGLAPHQSASGDIYTSESENEGDGGRVLHLDFPPLGPLVYPQACGANPVRPAAATLNAEINPEGKATTFRFQYITEEAFLENVANGDEGFLGATSTPESAPIGAGFALRKASAETGLVPETEYRCRVVATNADAPAGVIGPEGEFATPKAPDIVGVWSTDVQTETADLVAEVNPLGVPTTGYFQYVDEPSFEAEGGFASPKTKTTPATDFGAGEAPTVKGTEVAGLEPGTTYLYRLAATNILIEPKELFSEVETFRTYTQPGALPDGRAYELVSPGQKNSAEVAIPGVAGGLFALDRPLRINAAASSGDAVTYTSWTSFGEDAEGAPSSSQYLSRRSATGWGTENISPFGFMKQALELPYRGFTPDLRFGALAVSEPPLTVEAQEGFDNLYLRDNETGELQALTIETPAGEAGVSFCTGFAGTSANGKRAFFAARGTMAGAPAGGGFNLYEWSGAGAGGELNLVSVLPNGDPAPPVKDSEAPGPGNGTGFGAVGGNCTMGQAFAYHAASEDGSTVFWSYAGEYEGRKEPLFARIDGSETIQLDARVGGKGPAGEGRFWTANADGSKVIFSAPGVLLKGAQENGLYRYDTVARTLTALTPTVDAELKGVIGASEDGAYVYFVAGGVLSGEEENAAGQKAQAGANNLYLHHDGEGVRFIAALSEFDDGIWTQIPHKRTARLTPDGRHLAFLTVEAKALSGFDSRIAPPREHCQPIQENKLDGDPRCPQAFLYDAEADSLSCASCNPAGSRPAGPTELPGWSNPYEGPRYLSDEGSRLYFESRDALSIADQNGRRDVYQFELPGTGSCSSESAEFIPTSGGCLSLISSGESGDETYLVDASATARDVFLSTREALTGWDVNENYDVYDAREGGGFPEPPPPPPVCKGEACKAPPLIPPAAPSPTTNAFVGPGNPKAKRPKKHRANQGKKHRGKGNKGKNRNKAKKHHKAKRTGQRRAGR